MSKDTANTTDAGEEPSDLPDVLLPLATQVAVRDPNNGGDDWEAFKDLVAKKYPGIKIAGLDREDVATRIAGIRSRLKKKGNE